MTKRQRLFLDLGLLAIFAPLACFMFLCQILPKMQTGGVVVVKKVRQPENPVAAAKAKEKALPRINEESYQKIQLGMTAAEVETIVGVPGSESGSWPGDSVGLLGDYTSNKNRDFLLQEIEQTSLRIERGSLQRSHQWWTCDTYGIMVCYDQKDKVASKLRIPYVGILPDYPAQEKPPVGGIVRDKPFYSRNLDLSPVIKEPPDVFESVIEPLAFSSDGALLATYQGSRFAGESGCIVIWETRTGLQRQVLQVPGKGVSAVAFSPDGSQMAAGLLYYRRDNELCFWDVSTGKIGEHSYPHKGQSISLAYSPDGKYLASGSVGVRFWDAKTLKELQHIQPPLGGLFAEVAFSRDGKRLIAISENLAMEYDLEGNKLLAHMKCPGSSGFPFKTAMSDDGKTLRTFGGEDSRRCDKWDVASGDRVGFGHLAFPPDSLRFAPDGKTVAWTASQGKSFELSRIYISDLESDKKTRKIECPFCPSSFLFSPDSKLLALGALGDGLRLYKVSDGALVRTFCEGPQPVFDIRFLGKDTFVALTENGALNSWDLKTFKHSEYRKVLLPAGELLASWDLQGNRLATASRKGSLRLWETMTGKLIWQKHNLLGFLPMRKPYPETNGNRIETIFGLPGPALILTDEGAEFSGSGGGARKLTPELLPRKPIVFSSDGSLLAFLGKDTSIHVCDTATGKQINNISIPFPLHCLAISQSLLVCAGRENNPQIKVFHLKTGNELEAIKLPDGLDSPNGLAVGKTAGFAAGMQFSPDGQWLAIVEKMEISTMQRKRRTNNTNGQIHVWKIKNDNKGLTLPHGTSEVFAFSPDGKYLAFQMTSKWNAAWSGEGIGIWDLRQQQLAQVIVHKNNDISQLAFSTDNRLLAGVGLETQTYLWDITTRKQIIVPENAK